MADDVAKRAFDILISRGLAPHQAAAMVGHMMAESGGNPTIREAGGKGPGYGLFQWTSPDRRAGLDTFAKDRPWVDKNSLEGQLDYALHEMDTTEKAAGERLYGSKDYPTAINAGMHYLRPSGYTPDNPEGGHNHAGRYNFGAPLAGVDPMTGGAPPPMGAPQAIAGGPGLLQGGIGPAPGSNIDDEIASWSKYGDPTDKQMAGIAAAGKQAGALGSSLMAAATPARTQMKLQENANAPQQMAAMPNVAGGFEQQLAQTRLKRKPWGM
jgi:hypothetical protein